MSLLTWIRSLGRLPRHNPEGYPSTPAGVPVFKTQVPEKEPEDPEVLTIQALRRFTWCHRTEGARDYLYCVPHPQIKVRLHYSNVYASWRADYIAIKDEIVEMRSPHEDKIQNLVMSQMRKIETETEFKKKNATEVARAKAARALAGILS